MSHLPVTSQSKSVSYREVNGVTSSKPTILLWRLLTSLALLIGIISLRYALPRIPFPAHLPNYMINKDALIVHALSASLALLLGPWQFRPGLRQRRPQVHRWMGRGYAIALLVAAVSAIWIAPHAAGGYVSSAGFLGLALGWLITTTAGDLAIRRRRVAIHRHWMIRSYALTASAITLRTYLAFIPLFHLRFAIAYPAISWLCWVPNLLVAEGWIRRKVRPATSKPTNFIQTTPPHQQL
jgi:uncharacterized membrane protein